MLALTLCCLWLGPEGKRNPQFQKEVGAELLCPLLGIRGGTTAPAWAGGQGLMPPSVWIPALCALAQGTN